MNLPPPPPPPSIPAQSKAPVPTQLKGSRTSAKKAIYERMREVRDSNAFATILKLNLLGSSNPKGEKESQEMMFDSYFGVQTHLMLRSGLDNKISAPLIKESPWNEQQVVKGTQSWINDFVAARKLCPFASSHKVRVCNAVFCRDTDKEAQMFDDANSIIDAMTFACCQAVELLEDTEKLTSRILVFPNFALNFEEFQILNQGIQISLAHKDLLDKVDVVSFYPKDADHPFMLLNQAPWPSIHLLRVEDLERLGSLDPLQIDSIRKRNQRYLLELPKSEQEELMKSMCSEHRSLHGATSR